MSLRDLSFRDMQEGQNSGCIALLSIGSSITVLFEEDRE